MQNSADLWIAIVARIVGAVAGTILALVFMPPAHRREGHRRAVFSGICGLVFAGFARSTFGFSADVEGFIAGACVAAAMSWWLMGAAVKSAELWTGWKRGDGKE